MTQRWARLVGLVLGLVAGAAPAAVAQDDPRFALVVSFPSPAVAFQWEVAEKLALRFEGSYRYESSELSESSSFGGATEHVYLNGTSSQVIFAIPGGESRSESTTHSGSIGIAGILTIHRSDQLRLYVAPRISVALTRQQLAIEYKGEPIRGEYRMDFVCYEEIVLEIKARSNTGPADHAQVISYLASSKRRVGLLLNFGGAKLEHKRFVWTPHDLRHAAKPADA